MRSNFHLNRKKILFNLLLVIFPLITFSQKNSNRKNYLMADFGYPIPASGSTFNRIYVGIVDAKLGYGMVIKKITIGLNVSYSYFRVSPKILETNNTMMILSPGLTLGYEFTVAKKIFIHPLIKCGYDVITFKGKDTDGNRLPSYRQGGLSLMPMIAAGYFITEKWGVGVNGSYKIIFQHFGNNAVKEESTTRITGLGITILYKL